MFSSFKKSSAGRIIGLTVVLVAVVMMAPLVSYLSVVFGWTNPSEAPPGGSGVLTAFEGKLGINTSTPQTALSVVGTITTSEVTGLAAPVDDADAANKAYVDANGGGSGATITMYAVAMQPDPQGGPFTRPGGNIAAGCRGIYGGTFGAACMPAVHVAAGLNVPACPQGWTEALAGYGPMNTIFTWYGVANGDSSGESGNLTELDVPDAVAIGTDSICSQDAYALMYDVTYSQNGGPIAQYSGASMLSACNHQGCNTCRMCIK